MRMNGRAGLCCRTAARAPLNNSIYKGWNSNRYIYIFYLFLFSSSRNENSLSHLIINVRKSRAGSWGVLLLLPDANQLHKTLSLKPSRPAPPSHRQVFFSSLSFLMSPRRPIGLVAGAGAGGLPSGEDDWCEINSHPGAGTHHIRIRRSIYQWNLVLLLARAATFPVAFWWLPSES